MSVLAFISGDCPSISLNQHQRIQQIRDDVADTLSTCLPANAPASRLFDVSFLLSTMPFKKTLPWFFLFLTFCLSDPVFSASSLSLTSYYCFAICISSSLHISYPLFRSPLIVRSHHFRYILGSVSSTNCLIYKPIQYAHCRLGCR